RRSRIQESVAEKHRVRSHLRRSRVSSRLFDHLDERRHDAVPADLMKGHPGTGLRASTETRPQRDRETRERLLRTAARLFADRGFKKVTVRDICRTARANVAAVNYHFGDKLGLYREVLQLAAEALRSTT